MIESATYLLIGASVTAVSFFWQPPSLGHMLAERAGAPVKVYAYSGAKLDAVMPPDAEIREAAMVISVDGFYWYRNSGKEDCEIAAATAEHLFKARGDRPMILATVPGEHCINALLRERCKGSCTLLEPEPFDGLHPDRAYMERAFERFTHATGAAK